jgi:hypothetical protein
LKEKVVIIGMNEVRNKLINFIFFIWSDCANRLNDKDFCWCSVWAY